MAHAWHFDQDSPASLRWLPSCRSVLVHLPSFSHGYSNPIRSHDVPRGQWYSITIKVLSMYFPVKHPPTPYLALRRVAGRRWFRVASIISHPILGFRLAGDDTFSDFHQGTQLAEFLIGITRRAWMGKFSGLFRVPSERSLVIGCLEFPLYSLTIWL